MTSMDERVERERVAGDPTVGGLRGKKEKCSTRDRLLVDSGFGSFFKLRVREFLQTPRGRIFSLLGFYSHF